MKKILLSLLLAAASLANAQSNYALSLNGTNYVDCGKNAVFDANNLRTMECWVKFSSLAGSQEILSKSISGQGIELLIYNNTLSAYFMNGPDVSFISYATSNLQTGVWYHVAIAWDGTKESMRLYVNGVSVGTRTDNGNINISGLANPDISFRIGNWSDATARYLNGTVDEVRLWDVNRSAEQIKANMFSTAADQTGLIAYYKMDEGSGTTLTNSTSVTGLTGTLVNTPSWVSSPVAKNANSLSFDGTNDLVNLGTSSSLKFSSSFTAELWVQSANWAVTGAQQTLLSCFESGGYGITLTTNGNLNFFLRSSLTGTTYVGVSYPVSNLTNNTWYHVAGSFDGRYIRMYINGNLVGTYDIGGSGTVVYTYPSNPVFVGADPTTDATPQGLYFAGQIDELRLWNTARTQTQIQSCMDTELDPSDATQTAGLVSYYTFNQGIASGTNSGLTGIIDQEGSNNAVLTGFALTGNTSNYVTQKSGLIILPLTYLSFTAQGQGSQVKLQWSTVQEINTADFTLQHSTDGRNWTNIGHVAAAGNSNQIRQYSFVHTSPSKGLNQYRIMQRDRDGKISYSPVRTVIITEVSAVKVLSNNITNHVIRLQLDRPVVIYLYNTDGKLLLQKQLSEGLQRVDVSNLPKGIYILNTNDHTEKIMLQ